MKLVLQIALGTVLGGLVILGLTLLLMSVIAESVNERSRATLQRMQQQQASIQAEQRQRLAAAEAERQRQAALARQQDRKAAARRAAEHEQAARKEQAWNRYYQPLEKCRHMTTQQIVVECGNDNIYQRRTFEQLWQQGHFGTFPVSAAAPSDKNTCATLFAQCNRSRYGCVSLRTRFPCRQGEPCSEQDQRARTQLRQAGIKFILNAMPGKSVRGCIGIRTDLGGTPEGAGCLQKLLGTDYVLEQKRPECSMDGYPYIIGEILGQRFQAGQNRQQPLPLDRFHNQALALLTDNGLLAIEFELAGNPQDLIAPVAEQANMTFG